MCLLLITLSHHEIIYLLMLQQARLCSLNSFVFYLAVGVNTCGGTPGHISLYLANIVG